MLAASRPIEDLCEIVSHGASVTIDGSTMAVDDLVKLVSFARSASAIVTLTNLDAFSTDDVIKIASFGGNSVAVV